jgi:hypothetical protein
MGSQPRADGRMGRDEMLSALRRWGISQPWAHELPPPVRSGLGHTFVIDCPDLACRQWWFAVVAGDAPDGGPEVLVLLPPCLVSRGIALGWAASNIAVDDDRSIAGVAFPSTDPELRALECLLKVGYLAAFRHTAD